MHRPADCGMARNIRLDPIIRNASRRRCLHGVDRQVSGHCSNVDKSAVRIAEATAINRAKLEDTVWSLKRARSSADSFSPGIYLTAGRG